MDPKDFEKEHLYVFEEFDIVLSVVNNYLLIEALNRSTLQSYTLALTDDEVCKLSHQSLTKITDVFEAIISLFEESPDNNTFSLGKKKFDLKFKKKNVSFYFKVPYGTNENALNFSLDLRPIQMNKEYLSLQNKLDDLKKRVSKIEYFFHDYSEINNKISFLEKKYHEFYQYESRNSQNFIDINKKNSNMPTNLLPFLAFSNKINSSYFTFTSNNSVVVRGSLQRKDHIVAWGHNPLKKVGLQLFYLKIEGLNKGFESINACIGVMTSNLLGKVNNIAEHNGNGCYLYGVNNECLWINNSKTIIEAKYGKVGDVFKILVNFDTLIITWQIDNKEIGSGILDQKQINEFDLYPVVTLAYPKESIRLI